MTTWIDAYLERNPDSSARPIIARSRNATHFQIAANLGRAVITGAAQYHRAAGQWSALDVKLKLDAHGKFGAPGLPARVDKEGLVSILGSAFAQQTLSAGTLKAGAYSPLVAFGRGARDQLGLVRETGNFRHEVLLTERGIKEQLILLQKPSNLDGDYFVFATRISAGEMTEGETTAETVTRSGLRYAPGHALDATGNRYALRAFVVKDDSSQLVYAGLPLAVLEVASYPLLLDPSLVIDVDTNDGDVWGNNANYATTRSTSFDFSTTLPNLYCGQSYEAAQSKYFVERNFLRFDLSSIDPDVTIVSATLGLVCTLDESNLADFDVQIVKQDWSGQSPLSAGNREAAYDNCLAETMDVVWRNSAGISTGVMYYSPPLDAAYLAPGGVAYYSLRSSRDKNNNTPPGAGREWLVLASGNHSNPAYRPILTVDYTSVFPAVTRIVMPPATIELRDTRIKLRARRRGVLLRTAMRREND